MSRRNNSPQILIDCDVIIDWLTDRQPHAVFAKKVIKMAEKKQVELIVSPLIIANVNYMISRKRGRQVARNIIRDVLNIVEVKDLRADDLTQAIKSDQADLEDATHQQTAQRERVDLILTRNKKDYDTKAIAVISPRNFILENFAF